MENDICKAANLSTEREKPPIPEGYLAIEVPIAAVTISQSMTGYASMYANTTIEIETNRPVTQYIFPGQEDWMYGAVDCLLLIKKH